MAKQFAMMDIILYLYNQVNDIVKDGTPISLIKGKGIFEEIINMKYTIGNEEPEKFKDLKEKIHRVLLEIKQI